MRLHTHNFWVSSREELAPFIEDDCIGSSSYGTEGATEGSIRLMGPRFSNLNLEVLLEHILKIAIVFGVEEAVSTFDRHSCSDGTQAHFQDIASIEGIQLEDEIPVCKGVQLVTMSDRNPERLLSKTQPPCAGFLSRFKYARPFLTWKNTTSH